MPEAFSILIGEQPSRGDERSLIFKKATYRGFEGVNCHADEGSDLLIAGSFVHRQPLLPMHARPRLRFAGISLRRLLDVYYEKEGEKDIYIEWCREELFARDASGEKEKPIVIGAMGFISANKD